MSILVYILAMALSTYLVRVIPFTLFRKKIKSEFFKSFLYYVPYAVLSAMTFLAIFSATGDTVSSLAGTAVALILAYFRLPLIVVAAAASVCALIAGIF